MKHGYFRKQSHIHEVAAVVALLVLLVSAATAEALSITSPSNGATVSGSVAIATAISSTTSWTDLYVDGHYLTSGPPFTSTWNSKTVSNGGHTISATAFAAAGAVVGSSAVNVTVNNGGSSAVSITAPANGVGVSGSVTVATAVSSAVSWTDLYIDGKYWTSGPPFSSSWNSKTVSNGSHSISASAFGTSGTVIGSALVSVKVSNYGSTSSPTPTPTSTPTGTPTPDPTPTPTSGSTPTITGTAYYVDSIAGRDSNAGTSSAAPWQTIRRVMDELSSLAAGDGVLFKGGDVWTEQFDVNRAVGSAANPIVFSSYGSGRPVLDEGGHNRYCIDALGTTAKYLIFNNFECRHATEQGVTFQTPGGTMPGITVENFYIHNTGPGCANSSSACVGNDPGGYLNQLDFEDFGQGVDGVRFINNTVKWAGGHNCLEVHHDTGAVLIKGNTVGPGCVHVVLDVKGIGSPTRPALITRNVASCGYSQGLCGCQGGSCNPTPSFYTENVYSPNETLTYSMNVAYDSGVGFQNCPGGCANGSGCAMNVKYYNNTAYIKSSVPDSFAFYANGSCDGAAVPSTAIDLRNNIFDGSVVSIGGLNSVTENYNDIGGQQGSAGFSVNGSSTAGANDKSDVNPNYVNAGATPPNFRLQAGSPLVNAGQTGLTSNNSIGAY